MCRCYFIVVVALLAVGLIVSPSSAKSKPAKSEPAQAQQAVDPNTAGGAPIPPRDAQWTLYCLAIAGPDHVERANAAKAQLLGATKMKEWYVIHQDDQSVIYYGFYRSMNDPKDKKESARAQADRKALDGITDSLGNKLFAGCMFVEATAPDPTAPPQWDLRNSNGYWTIEIAMYKENPRRKEAAVDSVREARAQGVEAYYYHGPTASSVCIGAWPREAVREQDVADAGAPDPTQDLLVLPQPLDTPAGVEIRNQQGQRVRALAPRFDPIDPSLIATMAKYPSRAVNGQVQVTKVTDPVTHQEKQIEDHSVVVRVPEREGPSLLRASQPTPNLVAPTTPSQTPGAGTLKSIGK